MTIDVNVQKIDEDFLEEIDEIMEDTMVQMFFLQPRDAEALEAAKEAAEAYSALFYAIPAALAEQADNNCIGVYVTAPSELTAAAGKPLFIDEDDLTPALETALAEGGYKGIVLNAKKAHEGLSGFYLALGPSNIDAFDSDTLSTISMNRIVLQSGFPDNGFDAIYTTVKTISDALFRPEQSIIARATKHTLELAGFRGR